MKIILLLMFTTSIINSMDDVEENDVRLRLEEEQARFSSSNFVSHKPYDPNPYLDYYERIAQIVLNAGTQLSNQEKLQHLPLFEHREDRKRITRAMIEQEKIHPNNIISNNSHPLEESIAFNDMEFTQYLLAQGARLDKSKINTAAMTLQMAELFEKIYPPTPSRRRRR
jgi:hypothetical protein